MAEGIVAVRGGDQVVMRRDSARTSCYFFGMIEPKPASEKPPDMGQGKAAEAGGPDAAPSGPVPPGQLTPEEQMALFEKELKENDWGHQPG